MMVSLLTRLLLMVFGYVYPAYECFKTVEKDKPEMDQLLFWCQYWILVALLTVCERPADLLISWLPLYGEAKLALFIYLWYPRTRGATSTYNFFLKPYVAQHEKEIDSYVVQVRNRTVMMAMMLWKQASSFGQAKFFEILQHASSQTASSSVPAQKIHEPGKVN